MFCFAIIFLVFSCQKTADDDMQIVEQEIIQAEIRSCWLCITEDILGFAEGGFIGNAVGGPPAAIIGAAIVGSYRSAKQANSFSTSSNGEGEDYIVMLSSAYNTERISNPYNSIGKLHNKLLHKMILNENLSTVDEYYDFMVSEIKKETEFINYNFTQEFENEIKLAMSTITDSHNNNLLVLGSREELLYRELKTIIQNGNEEVILSKIEELELHDNTINEYLILTVAYHTYYFWENL